MSGAKIGDMLKFCGEETLQYMEIYFFDQDGEELICFNKDNFFTVHNYSYQVIDYVKDHNIYIVSMRNKDNFLLGECVVNEEMINPDTIGKYCWFETIKEENKIVKDECTCDSKYLFEFGHRSGCGYLQRGKK